MTTLLLPELARENAASNRRVARSVDTAASQQRVTHSAREALRYSLGQAALARGHWQDVLALFEDGVEGGEAREAVHAVLDFFDSWFDLARSTRALWQAAGAPSAAPEGLDAATREVEALRRNAEEMRAFLDRPRPPVDPVALEKARQAVAQGHYKTPEAVRANLGDRQG